MWWADVSKVMNFALRKMRGFLTSYKSVNFQQGLFCMELVILTEFIPLYFAYEFNKFVVPYGNKYITTTYFSCLNSPPVDLGLLCEVPRSHLGTQYAVVLLWTSEQPVAGTST
jgi:hypothetical protein